MFNLSTDHICFFLLNRELSSTFIRLIETKGVKRNAVSISIDTRKGTMRSGISMKVITVTLIILALMSATAFATVGKPTTELGFSVFSDQE
ncbi:MAG: hypothetical protein K0Q48_465 [Bacillota bacterium]|nr:hypothetical protein [Bacillota bacterium]